MTDNRMEPDVETALAALTRVADRTTDWRPHCWYWGDAIATDGLLEADALGAGDYRDSVVSTLQAWHDHCLPNFDDVLAPGAAIVQLVMDGDLPATAAQRMFDRLDGLPMAYGQAPSLEPHRPVFRYGLCIDAVYHLPAAYAMAGRWRDDPGLTVKGLRIGVDAMTALRCGSGWAQWFDMTRKRNNGIAWTRGLGWAVLGLLDLVHIVGEADVAEAADLAVDVLELLAATQTPNGNWAEVLDHAPAGIETSTASFYVAAALHPAAAGLVSLPPDVLERAADACRLALADDGTFTGVTSDVLPSWDISTYENCPTEPSPWGQGAAVRAFAALARTEAAATTK
ncbi:MAG: glycoside hydrolase family 88 protein [Ilumatobacteraceae bacterium]